MVNKDASTKDLLLLIQINQDEAHEAFTILYARFMPILIRYGESQRLPFAEAEDLAQDTLIQVLKGIDTFREQSGDGSGWIYRIYRNKLVDWLRRKKVLQFEPLVETQPCLAQDIPEQRIEMDHLRQAIDRASKRLPEWAQQELQPRHSPGRKSKKRFQAEDLFFALLAEERKND